MISTGGRARSDEVLLLMIPCGSPEPGPLDAKEGQGHLKTLAEGHGTLRHTLGHGVEAALSRSTGTVLQSWQTSVLTAC